MKMSEDIILAPVITEESMDMLHHKKYVFRVHTAATKPEIAAAVEELFGVEVADVHTISMKKKPKRQKMSYRLNNRKKQKKKSLSPKW